MIFHIFSISTVTCTSLVGEKISYYFIALIFSTATLPLSSPLQCSPLSEGSGSSDVETVPQSCPLDHTTSRMRPLHTPVTLHQPGETFLSIT